MANSPLYPNTCQVPNVIFDYVMPKVSHAEFKVIMAVVRKTYGWNKKEDWISLRQLMKMTGVSNRMVITAVRSLEWLISARKNSLGHVEYSLNIDQNGKLIVPLSGELSSPGYEMVAYLSGELSSPGAVNSVHQSGELSSPTKGTNKPSKPTKLANADPNVKVFIDWWCNKHLAIIGQKYLVQGGRDGKAVKTLLSNYPMEKVKAVAETLLRTKEAWYIEKIGRTLSTLHSHWNKLSNQGLRAQENEGPSVPVWRHPREK